VVCVDSAEEALRILPSLDPLVVLMDLMLPGMSGIEATRIIRMREQEEHRPPVYIVAVTASAVQDDREQCLAAGMNDFLSKPLRRHQLAEILRKRCPVVCPENENGTVPFSPRNPFLARSQYMRYVLLVEDDPLSRTVVKDLFRYDNLPGELVCVDSAEEALQILPSLDPLMVLMDLTLPGMSGIEATRIIKSDPATKDIRVWAITARNSRFDIDEALAAGCDGYFTKPVTTKQLVEQLRAIEDAEIQNLTRQTVGADQ